MELKINSDIIGASASTLCTIHCLATPFIFFASTCTQSCCASAPSWWVWIDFGSCADGRKPKEKLKSSY